MFVQKSIYNFEGKPKGSTFFFVYFSRTLLIIYDEFCIGDFRIVDKALFPSYLPLHKVAKK
jgi:hypothetical protein